MLARGSGGGVCDEQVLFTQGKVFPKLRKRSPQGSSESASDKEDDEATDYVFRIIYPGTQSEFGECIGSEFRFGYPGVCEQPGTRPGQARGDLCREMVPEKRALLVTVLPLIQYCVWVGVLFFCFNLSFATKSFVSAAAQQATTALMVGEKKKILAHNFSSDVHFGHVPLGSLVTLTGFQGWFFSCCHQANLARAALNPAAFLLLLQHKGGDGTCSVLPGCAHVSSPRGSRARERMLLHSPDQKSLFVSGCE